MAFPLIPPKSQWVDSNGDPLVGGSLEFQDPATSNPKDSYPTRDDAENQTNANANPITLDSRGEAAVFLRDGESYKVLLRDINNTLLWTIDDVEAPTATAAAAAVSIVDAGGYYVATDVEAALQELGAATGAGIIGITDGAGNLSATDVEAALAEIFSKYAGTTSGVGASLIGIEDTAGSYAGTDVEAALAELTALGTGPTKIRTSTLSRTNSTTPVDDGFLDDWTLQAAEDYAISGFLKVDTVTSPGIDFRCVFQTSDAFQRSFINYANISQNGTVTGNHPSNAVTETVIDVPSAETVGVVMTGSLRTHASNVATVDFQWAQGTSSGTATRLYAGSWINFRKIS